MYRKWLVENLISEHGGNDPNQILENGTAIYLLTPQEFASLPEGTAVYSPLGERAIKGSDEIDMLTSNNMLLWGLLEPFNPDQVV